MTRIQNRLLLMMFAFLIIPGFAHAFPVIYSDFGADPLSILDTVNTFRADLGADNLSVPVSFAGGRREINWDGGGTATDGSVVVPTFTVFQNNR